MTRQQDIGGPPARRCPQPGRLAFAGERIARVTRVTVTHGGHPSRQAQLALALSVEGAGRDRAERSYQWVKDRLVATMHEDAWMMSGASVVQAIEQTEQSEHRGRKSA